MSRFWCGLMMSLLALLAAGPLSAGPAHEHGVARLDVAVAADRISIELETPLDNLVGFERAPRTDAEREKAAVAVARLRAGATLFRIDANAGCTLAKVELMSAALALGALAPAAGEHADLRGRFEFRCTHGARAGFVEVELFEAFPALRRLDLQLSMPRGQMQATLRRPASRVALVR